MTSQTPQLPARSLHLCLVIASMGAGGAERVLSLLANRWAGLGHQVTLVTLAAAGNDFYQLDSRIRRIGLDLMRDSHSPWQRAGNTWKRIAGLRRTLLTLSPDVVISFVDLTNVLTLLAAKGTRLPVIISERVDPRHHPLGKGWEWLRRRVYPEAGAVVVQTEAVRSWGEQIVPAARVHVIANPVQISSIEPAVQSAQNILAIGRLVRQKGFDILLEAFAQVRSQCPEAQLTILGEGPERHALQEQVRQLRLEDHVQLAGRSSTVSEAFSRAQFFVLSSRFEGFPNVLLEAMASGLAVISTDCPSGPAEIVQHEVNGLLVPVNDVSAMAAAMQRLLSDDELREGLRAQAMQIRENYALERIGNQWDALVQQLAR